MSRARPLWLSLLPAHLADRLQARADLHQAVHNAGWLFGDKAVRMAVGILVGAWVARYLGPDAFGEMAYVLSLIALCSALAQLGLDGVAVRDMARSPTDAPLVLGVVLRLRLLSGLLAWLAALVVVALMRPHDHQALLLTAVAGSMLVLQSADTVDLWFQSCTQSRRTVFAKGWAYIAANALKVALILVEAPLVAFVAVGAVELAVAAAVLWGAYRAFPAAGRWVWQSSRAVLLLREGLPYLLAAVSVLVYMRIDQLMILDVVGEHELGLYSAMLPLSTALHFVPMAICSSIAPALARMHVQDPARYQRCLAQLFCAMWWLMLPLAALVAALADGLIVWLYGPAYAAAAPMLSVHVFSSVAVALGVAQSLWIVHEGKNMLALYRTAAGAVCNVALNLLLIPRWGGLGAAVAAVGAQLTAAVLSNALLAPAMLRLQFTALLLPLSRSLRRHNA